MAFIFLLRIIFYVMMLEKMIAIVRQRFFFHFHALIVFACPWKNQPKNNLTNKTMENEVYFMRYWLGSRTMCILSNSRSKLLPEAIKQINCKDIKHSKYLVPRIEWFQSKLWHDRIDYMRSFYICWINDSLSFDVLFMTSQ